MVNMVNISILVKAKKTSDSGESYDLLVILVNFEILMNLVILVSTANLLLLVTMVLLVNLLILVVQTFIQDRAKECIYSI